jgi:hypothetical protein
MMWINAGSDEEPNMDGEKDASANVIRPRKCQASKFGRKGTPDG